MVCNICSSSADSIGCATVLQQYQVQYYKCTHCGFVQTEKPYWLLDAYSETIARSDIGLIGRNIRFSKITAVIISAFFNPNQKFLDYGGGNGMFVRLMRDAGYDFYWQDFYTKNQFAVGFEHNGFDRFELLTAFEVFEHLEDPVNEIKDMLAFSENILFSTILLPRNNPVPGEWWYYTLDTGQHISLYSKKSLVELANNLNLKLYSNGRNLHLLTKESISRNIFFLLSVTKIANILNMLVSTRRSSLLEDDYFQITGRKLK